MITDTQLKEIRHFLKKSQRPLFIFDDDPDGLCAFLVLWKYIRRGKWMPYKGSLKIANDVLDVVHHYEPDLIVFLDKPVLEQEFVDRVSNIEIVHIDHHAPISTRGKKYHYYNPRVNDDKDSRPTTYWAYRVAQKDLWIAVVGALSDWHIPEFFTEFRRAYPGYVEKKFTEAPELLFDEPLGDLVKAFTFALKGKREDVIKAVHILTEIESPYEITRKETPQGRFVYKHFEKMNKQYQRLLTDALASKKDNPIFIYTYPAIETSFTALLATELCYRLPEKIIIVARVKDSETLMSIRSRTVTLPDKVEESLVGLTGYGGGHTYACGACVKNDEFSLFMERFRKLVLADM